MLTRKFILAVLMLGLLGAPAAEAKRLGGVCKRVVVAEGKPQLSWFGAAKRSARDNWRKKVARRHGTRWASWRRTRDRSYRCRRAGGGLTLHKICVVMARPCRAR